MSTRVVGKGRGGGRRLTLAPGASLKQWPLQVASKEYADVVTGEDGGNGPWQWEEFSGVGAAEGADYPHR
ncbi:hypothetical protein E2562_026923 [Oryza meyeriana var. granulata]|uniref:Uncharacterized protein n=1 Tax=Oryza meyeriana var. granulata TaxID=110450 RepID=A0A6G1CU04_9ORYZ|nr:hypothetical protein E2562_026923 [Oryza meyeriana var. granulata]